MPHPHHSNGVRVNVVPITFPDVTRQKRESLVAHCMQIVSTGSEPQQDIISLYTNPYRARIDEWAEPADGRLSDSDAVVGRIDVAPIRLAMDNLTDQF